MPSSAENVVSIAIMAAIVHKLLLMESALTYSIPFKAATIRTIDPARATIDKVLASKLSISLNLESTPSNVIAPTSPAANAPSVLAELSNLSWSSIVIKANAPTSVTIIVAKAFTWKFNLSASKAPEILSKTPLIPKIPPLITLSAL